MWAETTLRAGTKNPKICRDMFITDSRGVFNLTVVKNGKIVNRTFLSKEEAIDIIVNNGLVATSSIFSNCYTYRTLASTKLVNQLLAASAA